MRENSSRYSTVSIFLHWTIFVLIFANATFGGWMEDARGLDKLDYFQLHKSVGITVLELSLIRLGWRDRKSVVEGKSVSVRVDLGGRRSIKKKIKRRVTGM